MRVLLPAVALCALLLPFALHARKADAGAPARAAEVGTPVVVELFSSEGCSSCPPAEEFLRRFASRRPADAAPLIALEYHVDYWNYLGWKDPFSRHEFTERQESYSRAFGDDRIYTPELVVQGKLALSARSDTALTEHLRRESSEPLARVRVGVEGDVVSVHVERAADVAPGQAADVLLAVTESNLRSEVRAGENRGETLAHAPVVRSLAKVGSLDGAAFDGRVRVDVDPSWKRENLRFVAFVQARASRHILGAGY